MANIILYGPWWIPLVLWVLSGVLLIVAILFFWE